MNDFSAAGAGKRRPLRWLTLWLALVLLALFGRAFLPGMTLFSNDGPLGALMSEQHRAPGVFWGYWNALNWAGYGQGAATPGITYGLLWLLGPVGFSKAYAPLSLLILGLCAGFCLRQMKFAPAACVLGGLAAMLNSAFFSVACWGIAGATLTAGMAFLAVGLLADEQAPHRWARLILAGAAVGVGLIDGADVGALYSLFVAAFAMFQALQGAGPVPRKLLRGTLTISVVAACAAVLAASAIFMLVATQIQGVAGMQQEDKGKVERWDWATQWSLPKKEILGVAIPGLFGYRMDTPEGGNYWGAVGRQPGWEQHHQGYPRFTGGGNYAGIVVVIGAFWAFLQSLRQGQSVFNLRERRWIWYWAAVALLAALVAFGRHAPFYQFLYALPYFSTIRNPVKFTHFVSWALVVIFAFGLEGMIRAYFKPGVRAATRPPQRFDQRWMMGSAAVGVAATLAWVVYAGSRDKLSAFLQTEAFGPADAAAIARFSIGELGVWVLFLLAALAVIALAVRGWFAGSRVRLALPALGLLLVLDLGRANLPWIIHYDYARKYATNDVIDFLRQQPSEHRVAGMPRDILVYLFKMLHQEEAANALFQPWQFLDQLYRVEWMQHQFQYYNVQCLDLVQMPRPPVDITKFETALAFRYTPATTHLLGRRWQLANTRYLLGPTGGLDWLNQIADPGANRFRLAKQFDITNKPGREDFDARFSTNGPFALFEFTGALPRAKLYGRWQVKTNDDEALQTLASREFDPAQTVLVADAITAPTTTNASPGTVEIVRYAPRRVVLQANADTAAVLLLNDKFDPGWRVSVDGKPAPLLRCNFVMRGVQLAPGPHEVIFEFRPVIRGLYVSLGAFAAAGLLAGFLILSGRKPTAGASRG